MPMSRKLLALIVPVLALAALAAYMLLHGSSPASPAANTVPAALPATTTSVWNGTSARGLNMTFYRAGWQLTLRQVAFSGLNGQTSSVTYSFSLPKPPRIPAWVRGGHFHFVADDGRSWTARVGLLASGPTLYVTVRQAGLPTRALATGAIRLIVAAPDGSFSLVESPTTPPDGHAFAENKPVPVKHAAKSRKAAPAKTKKHR